MKNTNGMDGEPPNESLNGDAANGPPPPGVATPPDDGDRAAAFEAAFAQGEEVLLDPDVLKSEAAVEARFITPSPDTDVLLHEGVIRLTHQTDTTATLEGEGTARIRWRVVPRLAFSVRSDHALAPRVAGRLTLVGGDVTIDLPGAGISGSGIAQGPAYDDSGRTIITTGFFQAIRPCATPARSVLFHVANLVDYQGRFATYAAQNRRQASRATLSGGGWRVTLDGVPGLTGIDGLAQSLRSRGGHAITHVGLLEREDGSELDRDAAAAALADIGYFLSFAGGRWATPFLLIGRDQSGAEVWQDWIPRKFSTWSATRTWWNEDSDTLEHLFPGFMARRLDPRWRSNLDVIVAWFVECCTGTATVETALVLTQAALELVSWGLLVNERAAFSAKVFKPKPAAEKLRELLSVIGVPHDIPPHLTELAAEAARLKRKDGPHAFCAMRNAIVHAQNIGEVLATKPRVRHQAKMLGLWYLEMVILWMSDYKSEYVSRFTNPRDGMKTERVPWATPP